jgi:UPF0271 protein
MNVMSLAVDLNCDLGEGFGVWPVGQDEALLEVVTSANVACGFHAGDPDVMLRTVRQAKELGVAVGAHPGYPDLRGFGRREMALGPDEIYADTLYQIGALAAVCRAAGVPLQHVKPHGALGNRAFRDRGAATAIAAAVRDFSGDLWLVAYGGELARAGEAAGLRVAHEVYADRAYRSDGSLVPRGEPGAVLEEAGAIAERAVRMVLAGEVLAVTGERVPLVPQTICVHGDTPSAAAMAAALRGALTAAGAAVRPLGLAPLP